MTQEEKSKAYDGNYKTYIELINRLEGVKNAIKKQNYGIAMDILCKPYPEYQITTSTELKESEGLRIIKAIKYGLDHVFTNNTTVFEVTKEQCLSWLEKQAEHANFRNKIQIGDKVTRNEDGVLVNLSQLNRVAKKQGEQKLYVNDNAKEMFIKALERVEEQNAKGYKLTDCDKNSWWEDFKAYTTSKQILGNSAKPCKDEQEPADGQKFKVGDWVVYCNEDVDLITGIEENGYCINNGGYIPFVCESDIRLWTIEDAKDGDVLCTKNKCCPFIYDKGRYNNGLAYYYAGIDVSGNLNIKSPHNMLAHFGRLDNIRPATKERRDLLFAKMKEAGYEWDAEKKELKKIEQKPTWSEEDEEIYRKCICAMRASACGFPEEEKFVEQVDNWFKSLKDRYTWKPSDEQMEGIECTIKTLRYQLNAGDNRLDSLYNDLKKLRGK